MVEISKTSIADLNEIFGTYESARKAMKQMNIDQWQNGYPSKKIIKQDIKDSISYKAVINGQIVAVAVIFVGHEPCYDRIYNGVWITNDSAYCVIHRIAVKQEYKGQNIAGELVDFAVLTAASNSAGSIRVDTHEDNIPMQNMLKKNRFHYCGIIYLQDKSKRIAFERPL